MAPQLAACVNRFEGCSGVWAAARFTRGLTLEIGVGFHPDTPFDDYVDIETGKPTFSSEEAAQLEAEHARAWQILDEHGVDIYRLGFPVQRAMIRAAMNDMAGQQ